MTTIPFPRHAVAAKLPSPPRHLEKPERELWRRIVAQRDFSEAGPRSVLLVALDAHARARRCRERIAADGEMVENRFGALQKHPLISAEVAAQAQFSRSMKLLGVLQ